MRAVEIKGGVVTAVVDLGDKTIDPNGKAARGSATYEVQGPEGSEIVEYEAVYTPADGATLKASDTAGVGWTYAGGKFTGPEPEPAPPKRQFTFLEFMDLFTDEDQLAIAGAAMTDAPTKLWYDRAVGAQFISLDDPRLTAGLDAMVAAELLTADRRNRVVQGLPPEA
jgi:hypothetical protein